MPRKRRPANAWILPVALLISAGFSSSAHADVGPLWTDRELTSFSALILTGRVVDVTAAWDTTAGGIYTYVVLEVGEVLKGAVPARRITVKQLGGYVGSLGFRVHDQATFSVGEDVLVFLERRPRDATLYTSAMWQGKWMLQRDRAGERIVTRRDPSASHARVAQHQHRRRFADLLTLIRASSAGSGNNVNEWINYAPAEARLTLGDAEQPSFTLLGPARWREPDADMPVRIDAQFGGQPGLPGQGFAEMLAAVSLWNRAGARIQLAPSTLRAGRCSTELDGDVRIQISFMDPCGEISDSGGIIAIGGGWYRDTETMVVNGQTFYRFLQGDIINNDSALALQYLTRSRCFQDIQTHELGHVLGLNHSDQFTAMMFPLLDGSCTTGSLESPPGGSRSGRLGADDIAGLQFIYPPAARPAAPTNLTFAVAGTTVTLNWTAGPGPRAGVDFVIEVGSSPGASDLATFITNTTSFTVACVPRGIYFVRVRARSSSGTSSSSDEVKITLEMSGGCQVE